jgi:hypothetical protein
MAQVTLIALLSFAYTVCFLVIANRGNRLRITQDKIAKKPQEISTPVQNTKPDSEGIDLYV